ncbi:MAG: chromosome segregation protein SMC [Alphaproteobacteria bacterium]
MIQFDRLRLSGFKSFVDRTELEIGPGLNGIVGPNGCGKSNLVEALRWVMGENSAKRMRGDGMEDVIFAGTEKRSARNIAEVSLLLNNAKREAPAQYNNSDELEVIRRIEKDHGSNYKINGKNVRARDVQMLFADTVTGSNSPALVSQGRITQIINSKPLERRMVLEESAGISGLFARRHEAELRLKAADANLVRLEDVLGGIETQLNSLKRQARQASRYKNLNAQIRQLEALIAYLEWRSLEDRKNSIHTSFVEAEKIVAEKMVTVTQLTKTQSTQAENLPALRKQEAEAAATLQNKRVALQRIEDEAARLDTFIAETKAALEQAKTDFTHETSTADETGQTLQKLGEEESSLLDTQKHDDSKLAEKDKARQSLEEKVEALESRYTALMQSEAESKARRESLEEQITQNKERLNTISERLATAEKQRQELLEGKLEESVLESLLQTQSEAEKELEKAQNKQASLSQAIESAKEEKTQITANIQGIETQIAEIKTEISMLESFLDEDSKEDGILLDQIKANPGFEKALSRALGDSLLASIEEGKNAYWIKKSHKGALPNLPVSVDAIESKINAPAFMKLALSQIGIVEGEEQGNAAIHDLAPGQAIVSKDGHYWRWDGYCIKASAKDRNAQHLEYKNKLDELQTQLPALEKSLAQQESAKSKKDERIQSLHNEQEELTGAVKALESKLQQQSRDIAAYKEKLYTQSSEDKRLQEIIATTTADIKPLKKLIEEEEKQLKAYQENSNKQSGAQKNDIYQSLSEAREAHQEAIRIFERFQQQQNTRKARLQAIADERVNLKNRNIRANERVKVLQGRIDDLDNKYKVLKERPRNFENDKNALLEEISKLERARNDAAEKLAVCESEVLETGKALKDAENVLGSAREKRAHAQATLSGIAEQLESLNERIADKFDLKPQNLREHITLDLDNISHNDLESYQEKREKLIRERENLGAVNLRAEEEALEIEQQAGTLLHERNDLMQAIEELRNGINTINKEARTRLMAAFEHVNAHFQNLFKRLFQGGHAHLALVESDDPLKSGLEIFAQPPGKSLQSLSLLSGGEQTLASIALIFAMFLTNPSPICVLDEIDAPLDDANVDRLCDMLDEIAERGETRFLIVTHHRLTMARMDRLYGVTMAEKGVSQLVSVDLQQSFEFLDEAA